MATGYAGGRRPRRALQIDSSGARLMLAPDTGSTSTTSIRVPPADRGRDLRIPTMPATIPI
jgi:hypothetical protein